MAISDFIKDKIKKGKQAATSAAFYLSSGLKQANDEAFSGYGENVEGGLGHTINQQAHSNRVAQDLLNGVVTQATQELAYRTIKVEEEAKNYEFFSPTLALKYDNGYFNTHFSDCENSEGLKIKFVQNNKLLNQSILSSFKEIGVDKNNKELFENAKQEDGRTVINIGKVKLSGEYILKLKYETVPRFQLGKKVERMVIKEKDDDKVVLDLYCSKYPNSEVFTSKPFLREIESIMQTGRKSTLTEIHSIELLTSGAIGVKDNLRYKFKIDSFINIVEYNGFYVLKFNATIIENGYDVTSEVKSDSMEKKYAEKAKKDYVIYLSPESINRSYICEECGKVVKFDIEEIEKAPITDSTEMDLVLNEKGEQVKDFETDSHTTDYFDLEIIEQTTGRKLCRDCFNKFIKQI